jgi:hypothetical protein
MPSPTDCIQIGYLSSNASSGLLENGLDFIVSGLRHRSTIEEDSHLKYAVLHLLARIETGFEG